MRGTCWAIHCSCMLFGKVHVKHKGGRGHVQHRGSLSAGHLPAGSNNRDGNNKRCCEIVSPGPKCDVDTARMKPLDMWQYTLRITAVNMHIQNNKTHTLAFPNFPNPFFAFLCKCNSRATIRITTVVPRHPQTTQQQGQQQTSHSQHPLSTALQTPRPRRVQAQGGGGECGCVCVCGLGSTLGSMC
jgi:hypothetical protein